MKTSVPRIRSVTEKKTGRKLHIIRHQPINDRRSIDRRVKGVLDGFFDYGTDSAGFAFIIWDKSGQSMSVQQVFNTNAVPRALMPDFVRNILMINVTKDW